MKINWFKKRETKRKHSKEEVRNELIKYGYEEIYNFESSEFQNPDDEREAFIVFKVEDKEIKILISNYIYDNNYYFIVDDEYKLFIDNEKIGEYFSIKNEQEYSKRRKERMILRDKLLSLQNNKLK